MVCRPGSADQISSSNSPDSPVAIMAVLPDRITAATTLPSGDATRPRRRGWNPAGGDHPELVSLDQHEAATIGTGQLAQAGGDPVEYRLEVALRVHVRD